VLDFQVGGYIAIMTTGQRLAFTMLLLVALASRASAQTLDHPTLDDLSNQLNAKKAQQAAEARQRSKEVRRQLVQQVLGTWEGRQEEAEWTDGRCHYRLSREFTLVHDDVDKGPHQWFGYYSVDKTFWGSLTLKYTGNAQSSGCDNWESTLKGGDIIEKVGGQLTARFYGWSSCEGVRCRDIGLVGGYMTWTVLGEGQVEMQTAAFVFEHRAFDMETVRLNKR
jgi:hypothetical protein